MAEVPRLFVVGCVSKTIVTHTQTRGHGNHTTHVDQAPPHGPPTWDPTTSVRFARGAASGFVGFARGAASGFVGLDASAEGADNLSGASLPRPVPCTASMPFDPPLAEAALALPPAAAVPAEPEAAAAAPEGEGER